MKRKWKRIEPGRYKSGTYEVVGGGSFWELYDDGKPLATGLPTKKEAQEAISDYESARGSSASVAQEPVSEGDSFMRLRHEVATLAMAVIELRSEIRALAEAISNLGVDK